MQKPLFWLALLLIEGLLVTWSIFDHSLPVWDQACHLISGLVCCDLLKHPQPLSLQWYQSLLTISPLYPPLVYFVYGIAKLIFGASYRWVDVGVHMLFMACLYVSTYGLASLVFESSAISLLAAILACTYPHSFWFAHTDLLDLPAFAVIVFALWSFTWWQKKPSYKNASLMGIAFAVACLTKHTCLAFLAPPLAVVSVQAILNRQIEKLKQISIAVLVSALLLLPWMVFALNTVLQSVSSIQNQKYDAEIFNNLIIYLTLLPQMSSIFLLVVFLVAFILSPISVHRKMLYVNTSGIGALLIMSWFHWIPCVRYILPILIIMAMYTANRVVISWQKGSTAIRIGLVALAVLAFTQFVVTDFCPYPIPSNIVFDKLVEILKIPRASGLYLGAHDPAVYPAPFVDYGDQWVLSVLKNNFSNSRQSLVILPNCEIVSASTYIYLAKKEKLNMDVISPRTWTMLGDTIDYDPKKAASINWYILKTGWQGFKICDEKNTEQYQKWCEYVRSSGQYNLYGSKSLPDGSILQLYGRKTN